MTKNKEKILSDHKRIKKKLIPPMLQLSGGIVYAKWLNNVLPELIWIGLLQEKLGIRRSVEICGEIAAIGKEVLKDSQVLSFAYISNYKKLDDVQLASFYTKMKNKNFLREYSNSLRELVLLYPECPLAKLVNYRQEDEETQCNEIKKLFSNCLAKYFYRQVHLTNLMESTALYMGWTSGLIKYTNNVKPPDLNVLITSHPGEEQYEKVSSSIRSSTMVLISDVDMDWSTYFWNKGLLIDECQK